MTIKEAEERTGLTRANIRYYEDQSFFAAARGENGYRDYSEENINILLKVKLLRQLGFSLEEIHALQRGELALEPALAERETGLERESRELDQAARLCRVMREDGADFSTLDARRYLDRLAREESILDRDRDPARVFPWRRYFARTLDMTLCNALIVVFLQLTVRMNFLRATQSAGSSFLLNAAALVLMLGAETLLLHRRGTTPGKALLGLKVLREDGSRLSLEEAGQRTAGAVAFFGIAHCLIESRVLLLTLAGAAMLIWACWQVYHEKPLPWEGEQLYLDGSTRERTFWDNNRNWLRVAGYLAVTAACAGLAVGGHLLAARPPHRGADITVEQFVDNYNRLMEFAHGKENLSWYLTESGAFEEIPDGSGAVVIHIWGESPVPRTSFRFEEEGDILTRVTVVRAYDSGGPIQEEGTYGVDIPYEEIAAAARSFLWDRLGNRGWSDLYSALMDQEGNLRRDLGNAQFDCRMDFSGYRPLGDGLLMAQAGERQTYFVECTMQRTG